MNCSTPSRLDAQTPMFLVGRILFALLTFALAVGSASAQISTTGSITGRVLNAATGNYLDKALVTVEGTSLQALTNDFGEYTLQGVPSGMVTLKVTYTGKSPKTAPVNVRAGEMATQDLSLGETTEVKSDGTVLLDVFKVAAEFAAVAHGNFHQSRVGGFCLCVRRRQECGQPVTHDLHRIFADWRGGIDEYGKTSVCGNAIEQPRRAYGAQSPCEFVNTPIHFHVGDIAPTQQQR